MSFGKYLFTYLKIILDESVYFQDFISINCYRYNICNPNLTKYIVIILPICLYTESIELEIKILVQSELDTFASYHICNNGNSDSREINIDILLNGIKFIYTTV